MKPATSTAAAAAAAAAVHIVDFYMEKIALG